jgi:cell wall-associated NlpC family hydrolase
VRHIAVWRGEVRASPPYVAASAASKQEVSPMNRPNRRSSRTIVLVGAAGVLSAFAVAYPAWAEDRAHQAVMPEVAASPVAGAVAAAEAQAQAEAQAAAEAAAARQTQLDAVVSLAYGQVGDAYVYGASGPNAFDCSGLTMWVYQQALGVSLPHNTHAQWNAVDSWYAGEREPQPGDLVFFFANGADHVGIYVGDGMMVHAANPRTGVAVDPVNSGYWGNHLTGYGRVVH